MRWEHGRRSTNIVDRRGMRVGKKSLAGGGIGMIVLALVAMYFGVDPAVVMNQAGNLGQAPAEQQAPGFSPEEEKLKEFMSVVLADTGKVCFGAGNFPCGSVVQGIPGHPRSDNLEIG